VFPLSLYFGWNPVISPESPPSDYLHQYGGGVIWSRDSYSLLDATRQGGRSSGAGSYLPWHRQSEVLQGPSIIFWMYEYKYSSIVLGPIRSNAVLYWLLVALGCGTVGEYPFGLFLFCCWVVEETQ